MRRAIRLTLLLGLLLLASVIGWSYLPAHPTHPTRELLLAEADRADRIVVVHGTVGMDESRYGKPVFEVRDADAVRDVLGTIELTGPAPKCACAGNYSIEFYRGDRLLVSLGYHHGQSLRWHNRRSDSDMELTGDSRRAFADWFAARGFMGFREVLDDEASWRQRN